MGESIQCWQCGTRMTLDELASNDGDCPRCEVEVHLAEYLDNALSKVATLEAENAKLRAAKAQLLGALSKAVHYMEQMQDEVDGLINYAGGTGGFGQYEKHIEAARAAIATARKGEGK